MVARASQRIAIFRFIPAVAWMGVIYYSSSQSTVPQPPGISMSLAALAAHVVTYAVLAVLLLYAVSGYATIRARTYVLVLLVAVGYGISDELHQSFVPGRQATVFDVIADAAGAVLALTTVHMMRQRRRS